jgi:hypothetical protein
MAFVDLYAAAFADAEPRATSGEKPLMAMRGPLAATGTALAAVAANPFPFR